MTYMTHMTRVTGLTLRLPLRKVFKVLQLQVLRQDTTAVKARLAIKNFSQPELVDQIIALDDERKKLQAEADNLQAKVNASSKEIGKLIGQGKKEEAENLKREMAAVREMQAPISEKQAGVEKNLREN
jgi:seryl-tRNA synthetase